MSKKILSVLVVLALVLSMVPVVGLPATKAEAAAVSNANLVDADTNTEGMQAVCPKCQGEAVTWTELSYANNGPWETRIGYKNNAGHIHVYLSENRAQANASRFAELAGDTQVCLHLNGNNLQYNGEMQVGQGSTLNVMGNGNVTFLAGATNAIYNVQGIKVLYGTANIYGGNWYVAEGKDAFGVEVAIGNDQETKSTLNVTGDAHFYSTVQAAKIVADVTLDEGAVIDELYMNRGKLTIASTWTGSATITGEDFIERVEKVSTGNYTGTLLLEVGGESQGRYVANNGTLELVSAIEAPTYDNSNLVDADTNTEGMQAVCPHCGEPVTWIDVNAQSDKRVGTVADGAKGHYYLSDNLTSETTDDFIQVEDGAEVCFHLNGKNLNYYGLIRVFEGSKLNVMGNGNVVSYATPLNNYPAYMMWLRGNVTLYGGTWSLAEPSTTNVGFVLAYSADNAATLNVTGTASITAIVEAKNTATIGTVTLDKEATVAQLKVAGMAKLIVEGTWTGNATIAADPTLANWSATGYFTGKLLYDTDGIGTGTTRGYFITQDGTTIIKVLASIGDVWYGSLAKAVAAYTAQDFADGKVIQLHCNASGADYVEGMSYYIDLNGFNTTSATALRGAGTVYLLDSGNDTYDATKCGMATLPNGSTVIVKNDVTVGGKRYVTINDGTNYSAHRLEMKITTVTLKTSAAGLYFKAEYKCDATLAGKVDAYGIAVSKTATPNSLEGVGYSELTAFNPVNNTVTGASGAVTGILKDGAEDNLDRAGTVIFANSYIKVDGDVLMGNDTINCSLQSVLETIDAHWASYDETQKATVNAFYSTWANVGMTFTNIGK